MSLQLHQDAVYFFRVLLRIPSCSKIFIPTLDTKQSLSKQPSIADPFKVAGCLVSGISETDSPYYKYNKELGYHDVKGIDGRIEAEVYPNSHLVTPKDEFHYAFCFPHVTDTQQPVLKEDILREYTASKWHEDRFAAQHLMSLEQCFNAILPAGFFGAVLPRQWIGSAMKYMKWWNENVALVAKIVLPKTAVSRWLIDNQDEIFETENNKGFNSYKDKELYDIKEACAIDRLKAADLATQNWILFVWQKPVDAEKTKRTNALFFGTQRYSSFVGKLKSLDEKESEKLSKFFYKHDWCRYSVKKYNKYLEETNNRHYALSEYDVPVRLKTPEDFRILKVSKKGKPVYKIAKNTESIANDPLAVHIKIGPPVKLNTYSDVATALLHELKIKSKISDEDSQRLLADDKKSNGNGNNKKNKKKIIRAQYTFTVKMKHQSFIDNREWLLKTLCEAGLVPYILESEELKLKKHKKWLDIQYSPIKRVIRVKGFGEKAERDVVISTGNSEIVKATEIEESWETIYDDVSLEVTHPELWALWRSRGEKMKLDEVDKNGVSKWTYPFQFDNLITMACKQSLENADVMGLGKTRQILLLALLKGFKQSLFIVPKRLVGIWQEEIETVIANYVRSVRRNWAGQLMKCDYSILQWARDCRPDQFKTFNIISYESLPRVPKDSKFFVCPVCKFVVCSPFGVTPQPCPVCNKGRKQKEKEHNKQAGLRKYRLEGGKTVDDRMRNGEIVLMQESQQMFEKVTRTVRQMEVKNHLTGFYEIQNHNIDTPRKPHLKWTFSHLLRYKFNFVAIDESNYVNNPKAQRSVAVNNITGRTRIPMTGTPVRGYPRSIVTCLNWALKRSVFPDYRSPGKTDWGMRRFEQKYATFVQRENAPPKLVPKINNPELFQAELSPFILRHLRNEPEVAKVIPPRIPEIINIVVPMSDEHRCYYEKWLSVFAEWWQRKRIEEDKKEGAGLTNDLLVKLGYLINASTIPHFMLDNLKGSKDPEMVSWSKLIKNYEGKSLVNKFLKCTELIKEYVECGDKTIVFCSRKKNLKLGRAWCKAQKPEIYSLLIDGTVSNDIDVRTNRSPKQMLVDKFKYQDYNVLWAGIKTMKEGFNIPEANRGIFTDLSWEPADWSQALGRMIRPKQKKKITGVFLCHEGTCDEYMVAWNQLKMLSADEGIDFKVFDSFGGHMIPDFKQYCDAVVDGKEKELKKKMWTIIEELRKDQEDE